MSSSTNSSNVVGTSETYLAIFPHDRVGAGMELLSKHGGISLTMPQFEDERQPRSINLVLPKLGVAVARLEASRLERVLEYVGPSSDILSVKPIGNFRAPFLQVVSASTGGSWTDDQDWTWGLKAIGMAKGTGKGIKVAILDTGFGHCLDFAGRTLISKPFDYGHSTDDVNGHGSMCTGVACGGKDIYGRRYGIASEAEIYVAKVLSNIGVGKPGWVLSGIEWALSANCQVISASLCIDDDTSRAEFDEIGRRALAQGTIIVAAAGDNAPSSVRQPASSVDIMAIGGLNARGEAYPKSNPSGSLSGEEVDLAAPAVAVWSVLPDDAMGKPRYAFATGTSMAVPHVAGVAALHFENGMNAEAVRKELLKATPLPGQSKVYVGAGMLKAP